jgi:hypothetical protein
MPDRSTLRMLHDRVAKEMLMSVVNIDLDSPLNEECVESLSQSRKSQDSYRVLVQTRY